VTDLINSLADDILTLINANPRSPTKDEIAALLGEYLFVQDSGSALYKLPGKHCELPEPITDLSEAALEKAAEIIKLNLRLEAALKANFVDHPSVPPEIERAWAKAWQARIAADKADDEARNAELERARILAGLKYGEGAKP